MDKPTTAMWQGGPLLLYFHLVYQLSGSTKPVKRLWISSMEEAVIRHGFENLRPSQEFLPLYQSATARLRADWLVGMNMSRLFSLLGGATYHVGRVMSPVLAMVVARSKEISEFVPTPFYTVTITAQGMTLTSERLDNHNLASMLQQDCDGQAATVTAVESLDKKTYPPKLFDLTTLQREANRKHGFTANQTLEYAQALYMKQLITYPRTDSRYVTSDMKTTVSILFTKLAPTFSHEDAMCNVLQVVDDDKVSDHHALLPTLEAGKYEVLSLPVGEREILNLVTHRFVLSLLDPHSYKETKMTAQCGGKTFTVTGRTTLEEGFTALLPPTKKAPPKVLSLQVGGQFTVKAKCKEGQTTPPKHFTDDTLLGAMANANQAVEEADIKGIGTPATRASILEKLVKKGYMERVGKQRVKTIQPTDTGKRLIGLLPEELRSAATTAQWESQLQSIAAGKLSHHRFLEGITQTIREIVSLYQDTPDGALKEDGSRMVVGPCPRCGGKVYPNAEGYHCIRGDFSMKRDCAYFANKEIDLTPAIMRQLLTMEPVVLKGCINQNEEAYDMEIQMEDKGANMDFKYIRMLQEKE